MILDINIIIVLQILINILIIGNILKISNKLGIFDYPNNRKIHNKPIPLIGGPMFYINFILIFTSDFFLKSNIFYFNKIFVIFASLIFLLGFIDDKKDLKPSLKFFLLTFIISTHLILQNDLLLNNLYIDFLSYEFELSFLESFLFTLLCIILFLNASNLYDGINLQQSIFILIFFSYLIFKNPNLEIVKLLLIPLIFFIYLNSINKSFLGDSGTLFISYFLSMLVIREYYNNNILISEILLLMILPGIDMLRLFVIRISNKKNPFYPDKLHIHHLLIKKFNLFETNLIMINITLIPLILFNFFPQLFIYILIMTLIIYFVIVKKLS